MTSDGVAMFRELGADFYGLGGPTSLRMRNTGNFEVVTQTGWIHVVLSNEYVMREREGCKDEFTKDCEQWMVLLYTLPLEQSLPAIENCVSHTITSLVCVCQRNIRNYWKIRVEPGIDSVLQSNHGRDERSN